jgi:MFS family permease
MDSRLLTHREFRALWLAEALSLVGDQLARVALAILVFDRTGSAVATAATYAVTMVPWLIGGPLLAWVGDRYPRRSVMVACDLASALLVSTMAVPGLPFPALYVLMFAVTLLYSPFKAARSALLRDIFPDDRYATSIAVTATTAQFAQVAGFFAGGLLVTVVSSGQALLLDAVTFAVSALVVRAAVAFRPVPGDGGGRTTPANGLRVVFGHPLLRRLTAYAWLAAFHTAPAGVVVPYARGDSASVGLLLAATAFGAALSVLVLSRWVTAERREALTEPLSVLAAVPLVGCALSPSVPLAALLWLVAGVGQGYQLAANVAFVSAVPPGLRAAAFGVVSAGLMAGQGLAVLVAGALAEVFRPHFVVAGAGLLGTLAALALWAVADSDGGQAIADGTRRSARVNEQEAGP